MPLCLAGVVELLAEHVRSHERQSGFGDSEATFAVQIVIDSNSHAILKVTAGIDDAAVQATVLADLNVG